MRDETSPYRMNQCRVLPKFGSAKNPFAIPPRPESPKPAPQPEPPLPKVETRTSVTQSFFDPPPPVHRPFEPVKEKLANSGRPRPAADPVRPVSIVKASETAGTGQMFVAVASEAPRQAKTAGLELKSLSQGATGMSRPAATPRKSGDGLPGWVRMLNPMKYLLAMKPGAKPARARPVRAADQPELFLKPVKVARNDLSDADLEIVPARSASSTRVTLPPGRTNAGEHTAWGRLASRFFGADNSVVR